MKRLVTKQNFFALLPRHWLVGSLVLVLMMLSERSAHAQSVELSVQSREIFSDVPFVLQVSVSGFPGSPEPEISEFAIHGANVQFLGMSPRRTRSRQVRFIYSYRVEPSKAGRYQIPAITVTQDSASGPLTATSRPSGFEASQIDESEDMRIALSVPDRPVWLGETFEVDIELYLRASPRDLTFVIPIFEHPAFESAAPEVQGAEVLGFQAGERELQLPYEKSEVVESGVNYSLFQFKAIVTPTKSGRFELDAPRVVAKLRSGTQRGIFGSQQATYTLFKSTGKPTSFEVKGLPVSGRPASFSNAVGSSFSIQVSTSRSVVSVGEPIELSVVLSGQHGLEGLSLPSLVGEGRLDKRYFDLVGDEGTGQMSEDGRSKTFKVSVVLKSAEAREIPPIEFAFFDPERGKYSVARSQPIALNVNASNMVGAADVVASERTVKKAKGGGRRSAAFAGDLSPSSGETTLRTMTSLGAILPVLWALYAIPLMIFAVVIWMRRTGESRGRSIGLRGVLRRVEEAAEAARNDPAEQSAGPLINSIRELGRATNNRPGDWIADLESLAFDPKRKQQPVEPELVKKAIDQARSWCEKSNNGASSAVGAVLVFLMIGFASSTARAQDVDLDSVRADYIAALETNDRGDRMRLFEKSERQYSTLVEMYPGRPELLADLGNAALGAGNLGKAALAYHRALVLDQGLARAQNNLQWIRSQMPSHLVPEADTSAVDSLFFWHRDWPLATRHLVAAVSFMLFVLLFVPLGKYQMLRRRLAILPGLLFVATLTSALLESTNHDLAIVIVGEQTLYSADSSGAPPALSTPLPAGLEVTLLERRGAWSKVGLANNTKGWLSSDAVQTVE